LPRQPRSTSNQWRRRALISIRATVRRPSCAGWVWCFSAGVSKCSSACGVKPYGDLHSGSTTGHPSTGCVQTVAMRPCDPIRMLHNKYGRRPKLHREARSGCARGVLNLGRFHLNELPQCEHTNAISSSIPVTALGAPNKGSSPASRSAESETAGRRRAPEPPDSTKRRRLGA